MFEVDLAESAAVGVDDPDGVAQLGALSLREDDVVALGLPVAELVTADQRSRRTDLLESGAAMCGWAAARRRLGRGGLSLRFDVTFS